MGTFILNTDDWPDWLEKALRARASMHGVTYESFVAEVLTAFVEKREPEFKREESKESL